MPKHSKLLDLCTVSFTILFIMSTVINQCDIEYTLQNAILIESTFHCHIAVVIFIWKHASVSLTVYQYKR